MDETTEKLTVYFENPFWVGLFERISNHQLTVCKVTFGAEPKDFEVYNFINKHYCQLEFSPAVEFSEKMQHLNPKRKQRLARKQTLIRGIGTKSQQALQLQREKNENRTKANQQRTKGSRKAAYVQIETTEKERKA